MPDRATINEAVQIGVETTAGTIVAANRRLSSLSIEPGPKVEVSTFRPKGAKYTTVASLDKEWSTAKISGKATYTEIEYLLAAVVNKVSPTTPVGATASRQWLHSPNTYGPDTYATYSVESGSSVRAFKFGYGTVTDLGITFGRKGIEIDGSMMGQRITDGITMTSSPTTLALVPIQPTEINVLFADTHTGLDSADPEERCFRVTWKIGNRYGPIWPLNRSYTSHAGNVETEPNTECTFRLGADATGMGYLTQLRAGAIVFLRVDALGPEIESGHNYSLVLDVAVLITDITPIEDEDGVAVVEYTGTVAHDPTWGKAYQWTVINALTAL